MLGLLGAAVLFTIGQLVPLDKLDKLASVGSFLLAGWAVWTSLRPARGRGAAAGTPGDDEALDAAARALATAVQGQWTVEAAARGLRRPLGVRWAASARPVSAHPADVLDNEALRGLAVRLQLSGDVREIVAEFRRLPRGQVVVLGEPAAGKSALAILLTLGLLEGPERDEPVPVPLSLSSWHPGADGQHLYAWIAGRLLADYPFLASTDTYGPDAAQRLVTRGKVLPILDGLDELPTELHATAIEELDRMAADGRPLVVTCRGTEYEQAVTTGGRVLATAAVVELEPVELDDAEPFLTAAGPSAAQRWRPVLARLRGNEGAPLRQALGSPLIVWLARTVYADPKTRPDELLAFPDRAAVEGHLLDGFLPAVYPDHPAPPGTPTRPRYRLEQARAWLTVLADGPRAIAWWHLYRRLPRTAFARMLAIPTALAFGLLGWRWFGPLGGLGTGAFMAVASWGTAMWEFPREHALPRRVDPRLRGRVRQLGRHQLNNLPIGLGLALMLALLFGRTEGIPGGIVGLVSGLLTAASYGVAEWLRTPTDTARSPGPRSALRADRAVVISWVVLVGLALGVAVGLLGTVLIGRRLTMWGLLVVAGIVFVLAFGIGAVIGLFLGMHSTAWGGFQVARCWLAVRGRLPWRLMDFLDDAHRRGVLRQAGAAYEFRHATIQDHLRAGPKP
ncbi:MAG: hypothetical protein AUI14_24200 [Actinobacteria bacterium 13_2_20CM_2_71_6]|nr:MAG: hypothetical protein AUI14_24200 [Actinobacteria bacterium 13_2_20CM_2_71_6]